MSAGPTDANLDQLLQSPGLAATPTVFSIPSESSFVDSLARGLLAQVEAGQDPFALSRTMVLLPTRRSCLALRDAFLRQGDGSAMLLPRMAPIGDPDEEEMLLAGGAEVPPALPALRRQLLLTRLVMAMPETTVDQAAHLAEALARLLDEVQVERCAFSNLENLVEEALSEHWQHTLSFLRVLIEHWPEVLAETGALDAADRRNRVLAAQARLWADHPPDHPVIAAGSTGTVPAVADLLAVVGRLPQGCVVLPGLDQESNDFGWDAARRDAAHPQHGMGQLLGHIGVARAGVMPWPDPRPTDEAPGRSLLAREIMRAAETSDAWADLAENAVLGADSVSGILRIDAPGPDAEAGVIALLMRRVLEDVAPSEIRSPGSLGRTAALVTQDRELARRVSVALGRWGVQVDDSAGTPLSDTAAGTFLTLTATLVAEAFAPIPVLSALKHPIAALSMTPARLRQDVRQLERLVLRGLRPSPGIAGLRRALAEAAERRVETARAGALLDRLAEACAPMMALLDAGPVSLGELVRAHVTIVEALAAARGPDDTQIPGAERAWAEDPGVEAAAFMAEMLDAGAALPRVPLSDYPALLLTLMRARVVRPAHGQHPRLFIWGPLEARLQHVDTVILGGLNEASWPPEPPTDPWMSRPMRAQFGLPPLEARIGQSAHDFVQLFCAPQVILTRAARREGAPTVPARWLQRLDMVLASAGLELPGGATHDGAVRDGTGRDVAGSVADLLRWHDALDGGEDGSGHPLGPPAAVPPLAARPRQLSVTEIETLMRDPYAVYARRVLGLRALDPIDQEPGPALRGEILHGVLEAFLQRFPDALPADAREQLLAIGVEKFAALDERPGIKAFWWPRFVRVADWVIEQERRRRPAIAESHVEVWGRCDLPAPGGPFVLRGKADRVDLMQDGALEIIDYKTGAPPSPGLVANGVAPQLPLEAVIAAAGGFERISPKQTGDLRYWQLGGGDNPGQDRSAVGRDGDCAAVVDEARQGVAALIAAFDDPVVPYMAIPRAVYAPRYNDYAHLERVREWSAGGEDAE